MRSLVLNLLADAESQLKIECQQSSNTDPKFIKIYQKLVVNIGTFQAMKVAYYTRYLVSESSFTFFCNLNPKYIENFNKKCKNLQF